MCAKAYKTRILRRCLGVIAAGGLLAAGIAAAGSAHLRALVWCCVTSACAQELSP